MQPAAMSAPDDPSRLTVDNDVVGGSHEASRSIRVDSEDYRSSVFPIAFVRPIYDLRLSQNLLYPLVMLTVLNQL
jgi:hypothetical protein